MAALRRALAGRILCLAAIGVAAVSLGMLGLVMATRDDPCEFDLVPGGSVGAGCSGALAAVAESAGSGPSLGAAARLLGALALLAAALVWFVAICTLALDGSLPARLALWGVLPEAYAIITVRAAVALLRLKTRPTPVVYLHNCITDENALELADAVRRFGKQADLQVLELPENPALGSEGLQAIAAAMLYEDTEVCEVDISSNPQLGDSCVPALKPVLEAKASRLSTLRLVDCGLTPAGLTLLAAAGSSSKLRTLDLSYNPLGGGGKGLAALSDAPHLTELGLAWCGLCVGDVAALAEDLPYTGIKQLYLGGNNLGSAGLEAVSAHLAESLIEELGLESNAIEANCSGLVALATAWAKRPFPYIRLSDNLMTTMEVQRFVDTLRTLQ